MRALGRSGRAGWLAAGASSVVLALVLVACSRLERAGEAPVEPRSTGEVEALVATLRAFEHRIGFRETRNFQQFSAEREAFPFCGTTSRVYLPYSYEDPAIRWYNVSSEAECRALELSVDAYFGESEALGESATPITPAMLAAPLSRLIYVVLHEDCHDQFDLPYGVEEPLCNILAYDAVRLFAAEQYGRLRPEYYVANRFASHGSRYTRATIRFYRQLATLYARHEKLNSPFDAVVRERDAILKRAGRALGWEDGAMNNVLLANAMTYSRHYPFLEDVFDALGRDIGRAVAFFRRVDAARPSAAEVMREHGLSSEKSVDFLRAYEASVVQTAKKLLPAAR
jgi:hypothetical protein